MSATTGQLYTSEELKNICEAIIEHNRNSDQQGHLIVDAIFSMLEEGSFEKGYDMYDASSFPPDATTVLWSASKMGPGGIRYSATFSNDPMLHQAVGDTVKVDPVTQHTARAYMESISIASQGGGKPKFLLEQVRKLNQLRKLLEKSLKMTGWDPLPSQGGLCVAAKPTNQLLGHNVDIGSAQCVITKSNLNEILYQKVGIMTNGPDWTGMDEHRFVVSSLQAELLPERLDAFVHYLSSPGGEMKDQCSDCNGMS